MGRKDHIVRVRVPSSPTDSSSDGYPPGRADSSFEPPTARRARRLTSGTIPSLVVGPCPPGNRTETRTSPAPRVAVDRVLTQPTSGRDHRIVSSSTSNRAEHTEITGSGAESNPNLEGNASLACDNPEICTSSPPSNAIDNLSSQSGYAQEYQPVSSSSDPNLVCLSGDGTKTVQRCGTIESAPIQPFYPVDNDRPRPFLSFAQFDNDPELLSSIQDLNIPVLKNAVWRPNSDGVFYGGFGYIERALWNEQEVAVKFLRSSQTVSGAARGKRSFRKELIAWRKLEHPNILPFLGVVIVDNTYLGMVSPYMPNGSTPRYIASHPEANVLQILRDVAVGMSHLASQRPPIAHGDLKGANVLIDSDGRARICDFGLSRFMKDFMSIETAFGGTIRWMAPEQLRSDTMTVSLPADIFSWGMLSLELMTGTIPWPEVQQDCAVAIKVATRNQRPARPICQNQRCQARPSCACLVGDDALWALIQRCWLDDPFERPTVAQLCDTLAENPRLKSS